MEISHLLCVEAEHLPCVVLDYNDLCSPRRQVELGSGHPRKPEVGGGLVQILNRLEQAPFKDRFRERKPEIGTKNIL